MYRFLTAMLALSLTVPCRAADEAKPNTLTPKEIADGWILLFDGETTFGWDAAAKPRVEHGTLIHGGDQDIHASTTTEFLDFELYFEYRIASTAKAAPVIFLPDKVVKEVRLPVYDGWAKAELTFERSRMRGNISFWKPGEPKGTGIGFGSSPRFDTPGTPKKISFHVPKGSKLSLQNIKLKPIKMNPLFNGKDLTGWKKFEADPKRAKSQFSVSKEGWLTIKDGPGDLQTEGAWADFVLQLDCRTNGDGLNSGVFFRCIPGQYQNGYEAQINNKHAAKPKSYTIDEYDPENHKLKDKKKIDNWSADYGTGAIYRRIPARLPAAKDREWFTMTIVAHGRHIATWVNGIQVVDWDDNRPLNDNPRNGCRLEKGPISLQGHDPTTDLNFRNIRLADLTTKAE